MHQITERPDEGVYFNDTLIGHVEMIPDSKPKRWIFVPEDPITYMDYEPKTYTERHRPVKHFAFSKQGLGLKPKSYELDILTTRQMSRKWRDKDNEAILEDAVFLLDNGVWPSEVVKRLRNHPSRNMVGALLAKAGHQDYAHRMRSATLFPS